MKATGTTHTRAAIASLIVAVSAAACSSSGGGGATTAGAAKGGHDGGVATGVTMSALQKQVDLSQCGKSTRAVKHDLGVTTISGTPKRVVALEFSFADAAANAGIMPIGIADDNKTSKVTALMAGITHYTSVGLRSAPNLASISALKPDLIIADTTRDAKIYSQLKSIAPTISEKSVGVGYDDTLATDLAISVALGRCDQMKAALAKHIAAMGSIAKDIPAGEHKTFVYADIVPPNFNAHSADQWEPQILATLGLRSVLPPKPGSRFVAMTLESLYTANPDVMFLGIDGPEKTLVDQWKTSPVWKQISAVKNNAVYFVPDALWSSERGLKTSEVVLRQALDHVTKSGK